MKILSLFAFTLLGAATMIACSKGGSNNPISPAGHWIAKERPLIYEEGPHTWAPTTLIRENGEICTEIYVPEIRLDEILGNQKEEYLKLREASGSSFTFKEFPMSCWGQLDFSSGTANFGKEKKKVSLLALEEGIAFYSTSHLSHIYEEVIYRGEEKELEMIGFSPEAAQTLISEGFRSFSIAISYRLVDENTLEESATFTINGRQARKSGMYKRVDTEKVRQGLLATMEYYRNAALTDEDREEAEEAKKYDVDNDYVKLNKNYQVRSGPSTDAPVVFTVNSDYVIKVDYSGDRVPQWDQIIFNPKDDVPTSPTGKYYIHLDGLGDDVRILRENAW